jgi:hypothetical protein
MAQFDGSTLNSPFPRCSMTFALLQLNWIELVFLVSLVGGGGTVLLIFLLTRASGRSASVSQREELERLRDDYDRASNRIERLEEENRRLRQQPPVPGESRITPSE